MTLLKQNNKDELMAAIKTAREELNEDAFMFARVSDPCIDADQNVGVFIDKYLFIITKETRKKKRRNEKKEERQERRKKKEKRQKREKRKKDKEKMEERMNYY